MEAQLQDNTGLAVNLSEVQQPLGDARSQPSPLRPASTMDCSRKELIIIKLPSFISNYLSPQQGSCDHQAQGKQVSKE